MTSNPDSNPTALQLGFLSSLPSDVISIIFSFIDQRDCLTCSLVCRDWYNLIPQYATGVWEIVEFSTDQPSDDRPGRYRFLGNHVKAIAFDEYSDPELYTTMEKLISCGCKSVKVLEFTNCSTVDQGTFIRLLKVLGPSLTRLSMKNHQSNVALHHMLSVSPTLSHFTYQASPFTYDEYGTYDQEPTVHHSIGTPLEKFTNLAVLCLDTIMDKQFRLEPILKKCPNLRCFVSASSNAYYGAALDRYPSPPYESRAIDLDNLFSWCPKITNLAVNSSYHWLHAMESDLENEVKFNTADCGGIRHLRLCHMYHENQIIPLLNENQHILELVSVTNEGGDSVGFDCSVIFGPLHMPQLRTLEFKYVQIDGAVIVKLLNQCPLINTLVAMGKPPIILDASTIRNLQPTQALRSLEFTNLVIDGKMDVLDLLGRFPALEKLKIIFSTLTIDIPRTLNCLKQLTHLDLCQIKVTYDLSVALGPSKLQAIDIYNVDNIGYDLLSILAPISTLMHISILFDDAICANDEHGLDRFAKLIDGENLKTVQLYHVRCVPFNFLDTLGDLQKLETVEISAPYDTVGRKTITMRNSISGMLRLLQKSTSLQSLSFDQMVLVEDEKIYTRDEVIEKFEQSVRNYTFDSIVTEDDDEEYLGHQILQCVEVFRRM